MTANDTGDEVRPLPGFILAGVQKGGTTSLHYLLDRVPAIHLPARPQEIHYFDIEANYRRGPGWYRALFAAAGPDQLVGQTSPLYAYLPEVPARIHELLPEVKLLFILRNPISRAYSHYWHSVRYGFESRSFEDALRLEADRLTQGPTERRNFSYVDRGHYAVQLQRYAELFGRESLWITTQDALKADEGVVLADCCRFLGVEQPPDGGDAQPPTARLNQFRNPRSRQLQRLRPALERVAVGPRSLAGVLDLVNLGAAAYPPMADDTRAHLREVFADSMADTARWLSETDRALAARWD